ncbi:hypothetical protein LCGC14_1339270 [marine sediment metagenome]|uniref:Uncharacterized protein n=1 Tax=marine sediment metagenome TaxID=412755 RepID=A0A0F9KEX3_9ZZZZ
MKKEDPCEFGIVKRKCYFCDQPRTVQFDEHFIFCPNCSAIYSEQILQESHCKHFSGDSAIVVEFEPLFYPAKKPYVVGGDICSECGTNVWADGW